MKLKFNTLVFMLLFALLLILQTNSVSQSKSIDQKIDSLIEVKQINEKTLLIKFGFDALSAINTKFGIVIIDAGISTGMTTKYKKIIEHEFNSDNFKYVINTHGHHDHNRGNSVFINSTIIAHINSLQEISNQWKNPEKIKLSIKKIVNAYDTLLHSLVPDTKEWNDAFIQKIIYQNSFYDVANNIKIKEPEITFSDSLNICMNDITFEMFYFGRCHSNSDILIYTPELKILFIGDLFSKYGRLSINNNILLDKEKCLQAIKWIEKRMDNIEKIISGHGQILTLEDLKMFNSNILKRIK